jgi:predicted RNase H-like nuclease (RuvC/YqgF family)
MTIEKVSQPQMLTEFRERLQKLLAENQQLAAKIKENETTALKLQGAIETLEYYSEEQPLSHPPDEETEAETEE